MNIGDIAKNTSENYERERVKYGSLALTREVGESIIIGDGIKLEVIAIEGGQVKLGVAAPDDVPIRRGELPNDPKADLVSQI